MDPDGNWMNKIYNEAELAEMDGLNYNWLDEAWSGAFTMNHSVNVSGGSEKATYLRVLLTILRGRILENRIIIDGTSVQVWISN